MSITANLGLQLVDTTDTNPFDYNLYVVDNIKKIDAINIGNRLDQLETAKGNLRINSNTYAGNGQSTKIFQFRKTRYKPLILFLFPTDGAPTSNTLCVMCSWPGEAPAEMDVSAMRAFIPFNPGVSPNDHTHITCTEDETFYNVSLTVDGGISPANIMNASGTTYRYYLLGVH